MQHFNQLALNDTTFAMNLALFFASRVLDSVLRSGFKQVRAEMLTILQQNYMGKGHWGWDTSKVYSV